MTGEKMYYLIFVIFILFGVIIFILNKNKQLSNDLSEYVSKDKNFNKKIILLSASNKMLRSALDDYKQNNLTLKKQYSDVKNKNVVLENKVRDLQKKIEAFSEMLKTIKNS